MSRWARLVTAIVAIDGLLMAGCGTAPRYTPSASPAPANKGQFVTCSGSPDGGPTYAIQTTPAPGCRGLVSGQDYADGRVIIGVRPGTADAQLASALAAHNATVISSLPSLGQKVLAVPKGTVPEAVIGLGGYPFITFAAPDLLAHVNQTG